MGKISVIVPVYNMEAYVERCIESILAQTYTNLEIILVNDGSTDGSAAICDAFAQKDARIKVIHQENYGVASARNRGLEAVTGELVAFVDPDDRILPSMYEDLYKVMHASYADWVQCDVWVDEVDKAQNIAQQDVEQYSGEEFLLLGLQGKVHITLWCNLYKATLWNSVRFCDGYYYEDTMVFPKLALLSTKVVHMKKKLYVYSRLETGIVRAPKTLKHLKSKEKMLDELEETFAAWGKFPYETACYMCTMVTAHRMLMFANENILPSVVNVHNEKMAKIFNKYFPLARKSKIYMKRSFIKKIYWIFYAYFPRLTLYFSMKFRTYLT